MHAASKFAKCANMTQKIMSIWVSKSAEFDADFESIEKVVKKVISMKVVEFCTFLPFSTGSKSFQPYNFLRVNFFANFSKDSNSASNSAFFYTHFEIIWKNIFWVILALFENFEVKVRKMAQQILNVFYKCVLEFNFASTVSMGLDF